MAGRIIELDLRGLKCPLPVLRTRKALRRLSVGDVLLVTCTDPLATIDIPHLVRTEGFRLERQIVTDAAATFEISDREPGGLTQAGRDRR